MLKGHERWIIHYDAHLEPIPNDGPIPISLRDALLHIKAKFNSGQAHDEIDDVTLRILQMRLSTNWAELLIANFDPRGADAAYGVADTGSIRPLSRRRGESNAYSAHMIINMNSQSATGGGHPRHRFAMEDVPGLGKTRTLPFLNRLLRDHIGTFRDRQNLEREYHPKFNFWPYLAESLKGDVEQGELKHFELVKEVFSPDGFDQYGFTSEVSEMVKLKPVETAQFTFRQIFDAVKAAASNRGFDRVKVVYKGPEGNQRSAKFNPDRQDLDDVIQSKYERVELETTLTQCETEFCDELIDAIKEQM